MTNEEIIEELYWSAHRANVFTEFSSKVNDVTKINPSRDKIDVVEEVYREFRSNGLIPTGRVVSHHQA
jgi:hypothetical protein